MEQTEENKKMVPPYVPYKTLNNFLERLKVGIPSRIDRSLMRSLSGGAQSQLTVTLRYLNLINTHGLPKENLTRLVNSEGAEKQEALKDILIKAYSFLFVEDVDLKRITASHLQELFTGAGASGGTTKKCIAFFIAASKDAGIELSPHMNLKSQSTRARVRKTASTHKKRVKIPEPEEIDKQRTTPKMNINQMFLAKFPSFDPAWPDEIKAKWFDGFKDLRDQFREQSDEE